VCDDVTYSGEVSGAAMATQAEQVIALAGAGNALPFARFRVPFCRSLPLQQV